MYHKLVLMVMCKPCWGEMPYATFCSVLSGGGGAALVSGISYIGVSPLVFFLLSLQFQIHYNMNNIMI